MKFKVYLHKYYSSSPIEADDIEAAIKLAIEEAKGAEEAKNERTNWEYDDDFDIIEEEQNA